MKGALLIFSWDFKDICRYMCLEECERLIYKRFQIFLTVQKLFQRQKLQVFLKMLYKFSFPHTSSDIIRKPCSIIEKDWNIMIGRSKSLLQAFIFFNVLGVNRFPYDLSSVR